MVIESGFYKEEMLCGIQRVMLLGGILIEIRLIQIIIVISVKKIINVLCHHFFIVITGKMVNVHNVNANEIGNLMRKCMSKITETWQNARLAYQ